MPAIIAHRGASLEAPENTIRAFERAIGIGVDWIELDLRRTQDGEIVVLHDLDLQRLCGDPRLVTELTMTELSGLHVLANEFGTASNMRIPGFEEVIDHIAPRCPLYLEIKTDGEPDPAGFTDQLLDLIGDGSHHRIASFDPVVVNHALEQGHPAILIADNSKAIEDIDRRTRLHALSLNRKSVDQAAIDITSELDIELWTWTVDRPEDWQRLAALGGVDAWCTNDPRALRAWLADWPK